MAINQPVAGSYGYSDEERRLAAMINKEDLAILVDEFQARGSVGPLEGIAFYDLKSAINNLTMALYVASGIHTFPMGYETYKPGQEYSSTQAAKFVAFAGFRDKEVVEAVCAKLDEAAAARGDKKPEVGEGRFTGKPEVNGSAKRSGTERS